MTTWLAWILFAKNFLALSVKLRFLFGCRSDKASAFRADNCLGNALGRAAVRPPFPAKTVPY